MLRRELSLTEVVKIPYSEWVAGGQGLNGELVWGFAYRNRYLKLNLPESPADPSCAIVTVPRELFLARDFSLALLYQLATAM